MCSLTTAFARSFEPTGCKRYVVKKPAISIRNTIADVLFPCPLPGGYAALLPDGERNAEEDSASRVDFPESYIII